MNLPEKIKFEYQNKENGVSLIITFFIMIIILAVVLSISTLLYSEVKIIRNIGSSVVGFYAADSGIEKVLFYDKQVLPVVSTGTPCPLGTECSLGQTCTDSVCTKPAPRGLCSMYLHDDVKYPNACAQDGAANSPDTTIEHSVYCNNPVAPISTSTDGHDGCAPEYCDDCSISFTTAFDKDKKTYYTTTATVSPGAVASDIDIKSKGFFSGAERQIEISSAGGQSGPIEAIVIENACANPNSAPQGATINISANVSTTVVDDKVSSVTVTIQDASGFFYDSNGNVVASVDPLRLLHLTFNSGTSKWSYFWDPTNVTPQTYYVNLDAADLLGHSASQYNLQPCGGI